ncbi:MAG: hypothetical protein JWO38_2629 [Gemmataceae bacterium]|nr:hypothetical protein [Gemmataceae bacterium]
MIPRLTRRRFLYFTGSVAALGGAGAGLWKGIRRIRDAAGRSTSQ